MKGLLNVIKTIIFWIGLRLGIIDIDSIELEYQAVLRERMPK